MFKRYEVGPSGPLRYEKNALKNSKERADVRHARVSGVVRREFRSADARFHSLAQIARTGILLRASAKPFLESLGASFRRAAPHNHRRKALHALEASHRIVGRSRQLHHHWRKRHKHRRCGSQRHRITPRQNKNQTHFLHRLNSTQTLRKILRSRHRHQGYKAPFHLPRQLRRENGKTRGRLSRNPTKITKFHTKYKSN